MVELSGACLTWAVMMAAFFGIVLCMILLIRVAEWIQDFWRYLRSVRAASRLFYNQRRFGKEQPARPPSSRIVDEDPPGTFIVRDVPRLRGVK